MLCIVGLGNPDEQYAKTRHNAGRMAAAFLAAQEGFEKFAFNKKANAQVAEGKIGKEKAVLMLPDTMMNASGKSVSAFIKTPGAAKNLLVIHDDLDLPLGTIKMVFARGSGGHKGVESIMRAIKTDQFTRIRIGINPKKRGPAFAGAAASKEEKVIKHVIGKFKPAEEALLKKTLKKAAEAARLLAVEGRDAAIMFANTR